MKHLFFAALLAIGTAAFAQEHKDCAMHKSGDHAKHAEGQEHNCPMHKTAEGGDHVMGFSHEKTTHHFLVQNGGGAIDVAAKDAADSESRDAIRVHLRHVAHAFSEGDFSMPMKVHEKASAGMKELQKYKGDISYRYEETERGARVVISTKNAKALQAVHDFLRFQIDEHATGDPGTASR